MLRKQPYTVLAILSALSLLPACKGQVSGGAGGSGGSTSGNGGSTSGNGGTTSGNGGSSSGGTGGGTGGGMVTQPPVSGLSLFAGSSCGGPVTVGSSPVRRLSRIEYDNMVRDLGLDPNNTQPATQFVTEQKIDSGKAGNFNTNAYATISGTLINQQYLEAAEALATAAVASSNVLSSLLPSSSCGTKNAACASQFISTWANRAFRGQLDATETTALNTLYANVSAQFDFSTGIQAVIEAVLTSPRFLFVLEFGQPSSDPSATAVALTPMELATRLALYLWRSIPDQTLIDAANGGSLVSASDVAAQATRMLADPKAKTALADFADQWLDIENMNAVTKDTQFTKWTASVAADLHTESLTTFTQAVLGNSSFTSLLTSGSSYINANLASFYGLTVSPTFSAPTTVATAANPRMGILSQGSVLAMHSHTSLMSPTKRGRLVRQQILCEEIPDPPAAIGGMPIPPPPTTLPSGQTTRDQYLNHVLAGRRDERDLQQLPPVHGLDRVRVRQLRRDRRVHHEREQDRRRPEREVHPLPELDRHLGQLPEHDRDDHPAVGEPAGRPVLRAGADSLRAPALGDDCGRLLGAADLPGLHGKQLQHLQAHRRRREQQRVHVPARR